MSEVLTEHTFDAGAEFDRQVGSLLDKGYPEAAGRDPKAFAALLEPLRAAVLARRASMAPPTPSRVPFVVVVGPALAPAQELMTRTALGRKPGFADFDAEDLARFGTAPGVDVPERAVHVVFDVDRGGQTRNVTPNAAWETIRAQGRSPLTVAEGIALITHFPASLEKNNCFSLLASRCGDKRVPALWISKGAPKLGWCWAGNPHTWLGSASCAGRATAD